MGENRSIMTMFKIFLDTDALNRLSNLEGKKLEEFKTHFNSKNAELIISTVPIDEKMQPREDTRYREVIDEARKTLESKGIHVKVETSNITIVGIARCGYTSLATSDISGIYDKLEKEIDACEKGKGRNKPPMNIKRDAVIGVSPLEYSFLITTDDCLEKSFNKIMNTQKSTVERVVIPKAKLAEQSSEAVADCILKVFSDR